MGYYASGQGSVVLRKEIDVNEINDRLMGYDPSEDGPYAIGNTDIMEEIETLPEADLGKYMKISWQQMTKVLKKKIS